MLLPPDLFLYLYFFSLIFIDMFSWLYLSYSYQSLTLWMPLGLVLTQVSELWTNISNCPIDIFIRPSYGHLSMGTEPIHTHTYMWVMSKAKMDYYIKSCYRSHIWIMKNWGLNQLDHIKVGFSELELKFQYLFYFIFKKECLFPLSRARSAWLC